MIVFVTLKRNANEAPGPLVLSDLLIFFDKIRIAKKVHMPYTKSCLKKLPSTSQRSDICSVPFRVSSLPHVGSLVCWLCSEKHLIRCRFAQAGGFMSLEACRTKERWRSAAAAANQMARNPKQRMRPEAMEFGRLLGLN